VRVPIGLISRAGMMVIGLVRGVSMRLGGLLGVMGEIRLEIRGDEMIFDFLFLLTLLITELVSDW
jgi:hypothetical protein